ncbi:SelT/SelW/SelH family protein [Peribacillus glennii]|uniref:SelT/SelW/SelH family protein n=1 Tax=Peribacillus glennii TaxID=2303991 RepID=A0A372L7E4_9BACI|nr:SelT/SelW/SelH family protein [Peribacillus glennii]
MIPASGGIFEVTVNRKLIYSKKETGRFPKNQEIIGHMDAM